MKGCDTSSSMCFSFLTCSTCFSLITSAKRSIFMAPYSFVCRFLQSITLPKVPVPEMENHIFENYTINSKQFHRFDQNPIIKIFHLKNLFRICIRKYCNEKINLTYLNKMSKRIIIKTKVAHRNKPRCL